MIIIKSISGFEVLSSESPIGSSDSYFCQNLKFWQNYPSETPIGSSDDRISNSDGLEFLTRHIYDVQGKQGLLLGNGAFKDKSSQNIQ